MLVQSCNEATKALGSALESRFSDAVQLLHAQVWTRLRQTIRPEPTPNTRSSCTDALLSYDWCNCPCRDQLNDYCEHVKTVSAIVTETGEAFGGRAPRLTARNTATFADEDGPDVAVTAP